MATGFISTDIAETAAPTVGQLSFTGRRADNRIHLWVPAAISAGWAEQCRVGREYGYGAVDYIRKTGDAAMLPGLVRTFAESGTFGGVEVGFFTALSMELCSAHS